MTTWNHYRWIHGREGSHLALPLVRTIIRSGIGHPCLMYNRTQDVTNGFSKATMLFEDQWGWAHPEANTVTSFQPQNHPQHSWLPLVETPLLTLKSPFQKNFRMTTHLPHKHVLGFNSMSSTFLSWIKSQKYKCFGTLTNTCIQYHCLLVDRKNNYSIVI